MAAAIDAPSHPPLEYFDMLTIGPLHIPSRLLLAPLAGVSDLPFRRISREQGCEFAFAEMISLSSLVRGSRKTRAMLASDPADRPLGVQLLGRDPDLVPRALDMLRDRDIALIDVNAACPVGKVTARGEGAGLLREPRLLGAFLSAVVRHAGLPVTVKIRAGWDEGTVNAREVALRAQDAGVSGLFIHGRTKAQGYSGTVSYRVIAEVKAALSTPVIASGDALSPELIKKLFDETGCDGVALARGSLGNPWLFRQASVFLKDGTVLPPPAEQELAAVMRRHLELCVARYGERNGTTTFRKLFAWYIKGRPLVRSLKEEGFRAQRASEMHALIDAVGCRGAAAPL